jgi:hypothetical protein
VLAPGSSLPSDGSIIHISKFKADSALKNFYNFSLRPAQAYRQLSKQIAHLYEPVAVRTKHPALMQVKELKAVLESQTKKKFTGEHDFTFTSFEEEIDFWQELDIESPSPRGSFFLKEYAAIGKNWRNSKGGVDLGRLGTLIETTWAVVFNIWQAPHDYLEKRFVRLVEVFEEEVKASIRLSFGRESDLLEPTFDIRQMIVEAIQCCTKFLALLAQHTQRSRRKVPLLKTKVIEELKDKIMATYRTKSKVEFLLRLFQQNLITEDPASLMFLVKAENFMSSFVSQFKNNPKAVAKLEKEKEKLGALTAAALPIFEEELKQVVEKPNVQYLLKTLQKWFYFLSEPQFAEHTVEHQDFALKKCTEYLEKYHSQQSKLNPEGTEPARIRILMGTLKKIEEVDSCMN